MSILDIILGLFLAWGLYKGIKNGLFVEIAAIAALIAGIYGAIHFSYIVSDYLSQNMDWNEKYIKIASFLITFIIILFVVHLAGRLLTKIANIALLGALNKIAGGIFGVVKVAVILGAVLIFFDRATASLGLINEETKQNSIFYEPVKEVGAFVFDKVLRKEEIDKNS
ncbi:CvpA family protein [Croceivirga thetidis]|uniref:CvpA family protein n=1 Tax=Croceivirga thetidis TaxID=2721623 RepID=A0ABX1GNA8_9FLAO|nr:CvpA family protein [Croceivirga thetidis]NKI31412.1 CvpA family protein [Croceivirga thetidis]